MIAFIVLLLLNLWILSQTREPQELVEVKEKYRTLREHIASTGHPKFQMLTRRVPITGYHSMDETVGYNTNKGAEIAVCLAVIPMKSSTSSSTNWLTVQLMSTHTPRSSGTTTLN